MDSLTTPIERDVLDNFRLLTPAEQELVAGIIEEMASRTTPYVAAQAVFASRSTELHN